MQCMINETSAGLHLYIHIRCYTIACTILYSGCGYWETSTDNDGRPLTVDARMHNIMVGS
jgi:hypothetical protein